MEYTAHQKTDSRRKFILNRNYLKENLWAVTVIDQYSTPLKIIFCVNTVIRAKEAFYLLVSRVNRTLGLGQIYL